MRRTLALACLAAAVIVAGCGGGDGGPKPPPERGGQASIYRAPVKGASAKHPRGVLLLLAGGGWAGATRKGQRELDGGAAAYRDRGIATDAVAYRAGKLGVRDVMSAYQRARARVGPRVPICAFGTSAGGHLALLLATQQRDLACAVALAGPTDLTVGGDSPLIEQARQQFLARDLASLSPARHANRIQARVMEVVAESDRLVPASQGRKLKEALPSTRLIVLPSGPSAFIHSGVNAAAQQRANRATEAFITQSLG